MKRHVVFVLAAIAAIFSGGLLAQSASSGQPTPPAQSATANARGTATRPPFPPTVRSPEVNPNHTVTFRLRAPQAHAVLLVGEVLQGKDPQPMTKDSEGVWSVTIGPLPPEIWIYNFRIEGVDFSDPANISLMPRSAGGAVSSFVEVPGDSPAFYDPRPVPHGQVRMILYESKAMDVDRYMWVYTPPDYEKTNAKYPVYYLLHGAGETQSGWVMNGRANIILDNLIADGQAVPMIVVMPHGHAAQSASVGPYKAVQQPGQGGLLNFTLFTSELLDQIIPTVESNFRTYTDADHRAIGGLSMGAFQSIRIGLSHPELFHYVLAYSGGFGGIGPPQPGEIETQSPWKELLANPEQTKKNLHLLFLGAGQQETAMHAPGQHLVDLFKTKGIHAAWAEYPGGHVFSVWRNDLNYTVPMLFRSSSPSQEGPRLAVDLMINCSFLFAVLCAGLTILPAGTLLAQSAPEPKSDEYILLGNPNRGAGEPWVFVNPKDPKNIIVAAMATLNRLPTGETPIPWHVSPGGVPFPTARSRENSLAHQRTFHAGWIFDRYRYHPRRRKHVDIQSGQFQKVPNKNRCSDSFAGAGPDGTLYMGCLAYLARDGSDYKYGHSPGGSAIAWSTDKGKTWSDPVSVQPVLSPSLYPANVYPVLNAVSPVDRPVFAADASTGTIYVSGSGWAYTVDPKTLSQPQPKPNVPKNGSTVTPGPGQARGRTFIRASRDGGRTWGLIYPMDSDEYPGGAFAGIFAGFSAAHGHLAVAYNADKAPTSEGATCPCTVLGISNDEGKSYTYKVVPPLPADLAPPEKSAANDVGFPRSFVLVAADPAKEGRYAVARVLEKGIIVSFTGDSGKTWSVPLVAADLTADARITHHAMKYSPQGDLGIIWKAAYPNGTWDVWSAVSRGGAHSFKTVRVSHDVSPPTNPERGNFLLGDDLSSMDIDGEYLYVVWGDNRSGFEGTWFGRVPLSAY